MKKLPKITCGITFLICLICLMTTNVKATSNYDYLDSYEPVVMNQYTGNAGDSFIYTIGEHQYSRGREDINGNVYSHGLEAWIARWNYRSEKSWAYSIYNIEGKYKALEGNTVLIDSYNTTNFDTTLYFYGDGKLLAKYRFTPKKANINFNVNVSGVKNLKIYMKDNIYVRGGTSFGLIDCKLYKSNPPKTPKITKLPKKGGIIKGKTSKNVTVYINIGSTRYSGRSNSNGIFKIKTGKIKKGTEIKIWAVNKHKQKSSVKTVEAW